MTTTLRVTAGTGNFDWNNTADEWKPADSGFTRCRPLCRTCSPAHAALMEAWDAAKALYEAELEALCSDYEGDRKWAIASGLITPLTFPKFLRGYRGHGA